MSKILISPVSLKFVDSFNDSIPHTVDVIDSMEDLKPFLSLKAMQAGYSSVDKFLAHEEIWIYELTGGSRLKRLHK